jgi:tetratricopeptide (TPR) repeat protein
LWARRYEEADRALLRALAIAPDFASASILRAFVHEAWKGETDLAKAFLREARGRLDPQGRVGSQDWVMYLLLHNPEEALPYLDSFASDWLIGSFRVPKVYFYARAHEALGERARARNEYEAARSALESALAENTGRSLRADLSTERIVLARTYAGLERKEDALREAQRAVEIMPYSKGAHYGCHVESLRAAVEGRVGETDAAIEHIRQMLAVPCWLSPALLRIDPDWAPLRNDPRFRKLAELGRE